MQKYAHYYYPNSVLCLEQNVYQVFSQEQIHMGDKLKEKPV